MLRDDGYLGAMPTPRRIALRHPSLDEMSVRQKWLADPDMMAFNRGWGLDHAGYDDSTGCIEFPADQWRAWHDRWVAGSSDRSYWFVEDPQGRPVGHTFFRLDPEDESVAHVGVNIVPARRRRGLGVIALGLLLDEVRLDDRASVAVNEFEDSRASAVRTHRSLGFRRAATTGVGPDGSKLGRWELALRSEATAH